MRKFYKEAFELLDAQSQSHKAFTAECNDITASTKFTPEGRVEKKEQLEIAYIQTGAQRYEDMLKAIEQARPRVEKELATWKHANSPALTNLLLLISSAGEAMSERQLLTLAEPYRDDYNSINAIRATAINAGIRQEAVAKLNSDIGAYPLAVLDAYQQGAHWAFKTTPRLTNDKLHKLRKHAEDALAGIGAALNSVPSVNSFAF